MGIIVFFFNKRSLSVHPLPSCLLLPCNFFSISVLCVVVTVVVVLVPPQGARVTIAQHDPRLPVTPLPVVASQRVLLAEGVMSEVRRVAVLRRVHQGPVAVRARGLRARAGGGRTGRAEGRRGCRRGDRGAALGRWSGHGHRHALRFRGPAVVREPAAYDHGHQADQQGQHYVHFRVTWNYSSKGFI